MVAPPWFEIPPRAYGGIEWIVCWLVEGLVQLGHEVVLIAAGENHTRAGFVQTYRSPPSGRVGEPIPELVQAAAAAGALADLELDVVHDHTLAGLLAAGSRSTPTVVSVHRHVSRELEDYYTHLSGWLSLVAISNAQRRCTPHLPWVATVHNSILAAEYPFRERKDDYALFLGRMSAEKGVHLAIDAARQAGLHLVIASKCTEPGERAYFKAEIMPRLGQDVDWLGEADTATKKDLLSRARCLLFPIQWDEPFGMVMLEAMACGTPVVALSRGSVPEVIRHGETGFICHSPAQLASRIAQCNAIDPAACRSWVMSKFDVATMVTGYENVYRRVIANSATTPPTQIPDAVAGQTNDRATSFG